MSCSHSVVFQLPPRLGKASPPLENDTLPTKITQEYVDSIRLLTSLPPNSDFVLRTHFIPAQPHQLFEELKKHGYQKKVFMETFLDKKQTNGSWEYFEKNIWVLHRYEVKKANDDGKYELVMKHAVKQLPTRQDPHTFHYEQIEGEANIKKKLNLNSSVNIMKFDILASFKTTRYSISPNAFVDVVQFAKDDYYIIGTFTYRPDSERPQHNPFDKTSIHWEPANSKIIEWLSKFRPDLASKLEDHGAPYPRGNPSLHCKFPLEPKTAPTKWKSKADTIVVDPAWPKERDLNFGIVLPKTYLQDLKDNDFEEVEQLTSFKLIAY